eukprot:scaffold66724_cov31-Tisochrysis_lutea.AAC.2
MTKSSIDTHGVATGTHVHCLSAHHNVHVGLHLSQRGADTSAALAVRPHAYGKQKVLRATQERSLLLSESVCAITRQ